MRRLVEADVPRVVARRLDHLELELADLEAVAVGQISHDRIGGKRQKLRRHVQPRPLLVEGQVTLLLQGGRLQEQRAVDVVLYLHEVLHLLERVKVREHRHALAPNAVEVARVIGVRMGEHHLHLVPRAAEGGQGVVERLLAVRVVETHVHDGGGAVVVQNEVGVEGAQRIVGKGHAHQVEIGVDEHRLAEIGIAGRLRRQHRALVGRNAPTLAGSDRLCHAGSFRAGPSSGGFVSRFPL